MAEWGNPRFTDTKTSSDSVFFSKLNAVIRTSPRNGDHRCLGNKLNRAY